MTAPDEPTPARPASDSYSALVRAVTAAEARHRRITDPLARTLALTELIRALQEQLELVAGERDAALSEVLTTRTHPSHRRLARDLHLSRQRIDQLALIARRGGRERRG